MLKNGLYNIIGAVIRSGINFLTIPVIIRLMGVEEYGLWTLVSTAIGILGLAEAGLSISTTVFLAKDLANEDIKGFCQTLTVTLTGMFFLATFAAILLWIGADGILVLFPKIEVSQHTQALQGLRIGGFVIWSRLMQQVFIGIEQAYQCYGMMNLLNTLQIIFTNITMMTIAWIGTDATGLMIANAAISLGSLSGHVCFSWMLTDGLQLRPMWNRKKFVSIIKYSSMTWLTSLGSALFSQCDRLIVGGILGTKLLGIYAGITSITTQINTMSAFAVQPLLPKLSSLLQNKNISKSVVQEQIKQVQQVNILIAMGLGIGLLIFTPIVFNFIFPGISNQEYITAFRITIMIYALYSLNAVGYYTLLSLGAVKTSTVILIGSSALTLVMIYLGATHWGLLGASIGNAGYISSLMCTILAMKQLKIPVKEWILWIQPIEILSLPVMIVRQKFSQ